MQLGRSTLALRRAAPSWQPHHRRHIISYLIPNAASTKTSSREPAGPPRPQELHPTLRLIKQRNAEGSLPGKRSDPFKLGLVVEVRGRPVTEELGWQLTG